MDILSYILSKKNNGSNTGGSGGTGGSGSSNASVFVKGSGTVVDPTQNYSRLYFNTALSNEEVKALMNNIELNWMGMLAILYYTNQSDMIGVIMSKDSDIYVLTSGSSGILFAINGNLIDESITFTGWNPDIDFSNGIGIIGNTIGTEIHTDDGSLVQIGVNNDKIVELFSSSTPIKKSVSKGLSGVYDGTNLEVGSTHIDISSLLDENKLPLNIDVVDNDLIPRNIVEGVNILGVDGTYNAAGGRENDLVDRTLTTYTNNSVTSVGDYAFYRQKNLTAVNFSNVTNIGQYAFYDCDSLTSINSPKVTDIGQYAFDECPSLTTADFPEATGINQCAFSSCASLTSINFPKVTSLAQYTFSGCKSLITADFPEVTGIDSHAFSYCSSLTTADFPKVTSSINLAAFYYCEKLVSVNLPNATGIGETAFSHCSSLTRVDFPKVAYLKKNAFMDCSSLTNVNIPVATDIGDYAFCRCSSLTEINLPKAVHLRERIFEDCASLTNVDFPEASYIGYDVFRGCTNLTSVELPKARTIKTGAFVSCYSLTKVFIDQAEQICTLEQPTATFGNCYHILGTTDATYNPEGLKDGYIYVPASLLSRYKVATTWGVVASQIIGHENLEAGAALPDYTTADFTTQTWYSDERLTTVVTEVTAAGKYYCRLEA